jgi:hypothetical protein
VAQPFLVVEAYPPIQDRRALECQAGRFLIEAVVGIRNRKWLIRRDIDILKSGKLQKYVVAQPFLVVTAPILDCSTASRDHHPPDREQKTSLLVKSMETRTLNGEGCATHLQHLNKSRKLPCSQPEWLCHRNQPTDWREFCAMSCVRGQGTRSENARRARYPNSVSGWCFGDPRRQEWLRHAAELATVGRSAD